MSDLRRSQRVIEAVARRFSATWEAGKGDSPAAYLNIEGARVAIEIAAVKQRPAARGSPARPRLRFDRVALGLIRRLQEALAESVPVGRTVVITVTAPIRLASRTAAATAEMIRQRLGRRSARLEIEQTINGNQIQARLAEDVSRRGSRVIGYVHNPDSDPEILFDITESLLRHVGRAASKRVAGRFAGDRWLVVACGDGGLPYFETYRQVFSQLAIPTGFRKVLLVLPDGRVEILAD